MLRAENEGSTCSVKPGERPVLIISVQPLDGVGDTVSRVLEVLDLAFRGHVCRSSCQTPGF